MVVPDGQRGQPAARRCAWGNHRVSRATADSGAAGSGQRTADSGQRAADSGSGQRAADEDPEADASAMAARGANHGASRAGLTTGHRARG